MIKARQKEILSIIKNEPNITLEEIASRLGLKSVSNIHAHIKKLIDQGYLKKSGRSLIVKNTGEDPISYIPFFGYAQCGYNGCFSEDEVLDYIPMPTKFLPGNLDSMVALKARGDSMEPTIQEEELMFFDTSKATEAPKPNDVVLCQVDGELKIKRFVIKQNIPMLISDNKAKYEPIEIDESNNFKILGKMVKMK